MSSTASRVFCHECRQESIPIRVPDPHCALCNGTFVEELPNPSDSDPNHDPRLWSTEDPEEEALHAGHWDDDRLAGGHPMGQLMHLLGFAPHPGGHTEEDEEWDEQVFHPSTGGAGDAGPDAGGFNTPRAGDRPSGPTSSSSSAAQPPPSHEAYTATRNADSNSFLRSLFGMRGSDPSSQPQPQSQSPPPQQAQGNRGEARGPRVYSRTFHNGQGQFSFTVGTAPTFGEPPRAFQDAQQDAEGMPIRTLASFLQQAFGTPPMPPRPEGRRRSSDPPSDTRQDNNNNNNNNGARRDDAGGEAAHPFMYLINILNQLSGRGGGAGGTATNLGNYVWSEEAMADIMSQLMAQASGNTGPPPASEDILSNLTRVKMTKEMLSAPTITDCAICKDELAENDECILLPCKHIFHSEDCLLPWLRRNGTCPVCRFSLLENSTSSHHSRDPDEMIPNPTAASPSSSTTSSSGSSGGGDLATSLPTPSSSSTTYGAAALTPTHPTLHRQYSHPSSSPTSFVPLQPTGTRQYPPRTSSASSTFASTSAQSSTFPPPSSSSTTTAYSPPLEGSRVPDTWFGVFPIPIPNSTSPHRSPPIEQRTSSRSRSSAQAQAAGSSTSPSSGGTGDETYPMLGQMLPRDRAAAAALRRSQPRRSTSGSSTHHPTSSPSSESDTNQPMDLD